MATETVLTCGACQATFVIHDGEMLWSGPFGTSAGCNHRVVALESKLREENQRLRSALVTARDFIDNHPAIAADVIDRALGE